jgi:hypothetical protein
MHLSRLATSARTLSALSVRSAWLAFALTASAATGACSDGEDSTPNTKNAPPSSVTPDGAKKDAGDSPRPQADSGSIANPQTDAGGDPSPQADAGGNPSPQADGGGGPQPQTDAGSGATPDAGGGSTPDAGGTSGTPPIMPSMLDADIKAAGLDPANLPTFEKALADAKAAGKPAVRSLMTLFAKSLGIECNGCHSVAPFSVPEATKNITGRMWDRWVHTLKLKQGGTLFCDSCHQGKEKFLVRKDSNALKAWMDTNLTKGLVNAAGVANKCSTCHGDPFDPGFLDAWAKGM